jgi:hypothetical protein
MACATNLHTWLAVVAFTTYAAPLSAQDAAAVARRDSVRAAIAARAAEVDAAAARFLNRGLTAADRVAAVQGIGGLVNRAQADSVLLIAFDTNEPADVRAVAIRLGDLALVDDTLAQERLVALVGDRNAPIEVRRAGFRTLDALLAVRPVKGSDRLLRALTNESDPELRTGAVGRLSVEGDQAIRTRLIQGLSDSANALVPAVEALEMLAARPTPQVAAVARNFLSPDRPLPIRLIAVRLAAMDSLGRDTVAALIQNDQAPVELRVTAGRALSLNRPARFSQVSTPIITNEQANPLLRVELIRVLSAQSTAISPSVAQQVEGLSTQSTSPAVRSAASRFRDARIEKKPME